jgi:hypothetical protein
MKKKIAMVLIILMLSSAFAWADNMATGLEIAGAGVALGLLRFFVVQPSGSFYVNESIGYGMLGLGVIFVISGVWLALTPDEYYAQVIEDNPVLRHVSLGANNEQVYLGARFSF